MPSGWLIAGIIITIIAIILLIWSIGYAVSLNNNSIDVYAKINGILNSILIGFFGLILLFVGILLIMNNWSSVKKN